MSIIEGNILLVIDNAENLITQQRSELQVILSMMLTQVSTLRILLTSQRALQPATDFKEELILLQGLTNSQSAELFKEVCGREIDESELRELLDTKPNKIRYPTEQYKQYEHFHEHHLFALLNGNPQSINFVASQLAEPHNTTLKTIY